jgi:formate dehydrogenase subunit gamma
VSTAVASRAAARRRRPAGKRELVRFDLAERLVHWSLAAIVLVLLVTGAELYIPAFSLAFGHRALVEDVHVYVGICLPLPLLAGAAGPWRRALLADLRRLARWPAGEADWFRRRRPRLGKFNPGQKLNASLVAGSLLLALGTGLLMRWAPASLLPFQTGATLVHDIVFLLLAALVVGHVAMAITHPDAMRSMLHGRVSEAWARRHAPRWLEEERSPEEGGAG